MEGQEETDRTQAGSGCTVLCNEMGCHEMGEGFIYMQDGRM